MSNSRPNAVLNLDSVHDDEYWYEHDYGYNNGHYGSYRNRNVDIRKALKNAICLLDSYDTRRQVFEQSGGSLIRFRDTVNLLK
ncbi:MAG: hypothetical protein GKR91_19905 [Pseudomonadales bacterium]|nr:hypothetical protein [Pseudomonadales bacterium]